MSTISIFSFDNLSTTLEIARKLNGKKSKEGWITAKPSKYSNTEVFIQYWYYEDVEEYIKKTFSEDDSWEIVSFLKQNGKTKVLKRIYCFINLLTKTLEIYRGQDEKTNEVLSFLEQLLNTKFAPISLKSEDLKKIYSEHGVELKQVIFKNINGLIYEILRGQQLEHNEKYLEYLQQFPDSLRIISIRPKIKFLNSYNKYQVTINGDKGTVRLSSNGIFSWRPRYEIRQLIFLIASVIGLLKSTTI